MLAALMAVSAVASATEYPVTGVPEIGRCVAKPGSGGFKGLKAVCIVHSPTHTGNWEWEPGPGAKGTFNEVLNGVVLETTTGRKISCHAAFLTGEVTSGKTERFTNLTLQGCLLVGPNLLCYSNFVEPGTIETSGPWSVNSGSSPAPKSHSRGLAGT